MPKLSKNRKPTKKAARRPRRKPAAKAAAKPWAVLRGARNPRVMLLHSERGSANDAAKWLRSHFPGQVIQVKRLKERKTA